MYRRDEGGASLAPSLMALALVIAIVALIAYAIKADTGMTVGQAFLTLIAILAGIK